MTFCSLYHIKWARIHRVALRLCGGHMSNCGRTIQSLGMWEGSVRRIHAMRLLVHSHNPLPVPQSVILCRIESWFPHALHCAVLDKLIALSLSLVGSISCITLYHVDFMYSDAQVPCRFFPYFCPLCCWVDQGDSHRSQFFYCKWHRTQRLVYSSSESFRRFIVSRGINIGPFLSIYSQVLHVFWNLIALWGLTLYASVSQYSCHSAGNVPLSFPWVHIPAISRARLFASTSQSFQPHPFFL